MKKTWADKHYTLVAILLLLVVAFAWTYVSVQSTSEPLAAQRASLVAALDYRVVSQRDLMLWPAGTVFGPGGAAYFYATDPLLSVTPTIELSGLYEGQFTGILSAKAWLQAINDKGVAYWSYPLTELSEQQFDWQGKAQRQVQGQAQGQVQGQAQGLIAVGEQLLVKGEAIAVEVQRANALVAQIGEELDFQSAVYQVMVGVKIQIGGVVNGEVFSRSFEQTLPVTLLPSSFSAPAPADVALSASLNSGQGSLNSGQNVGVDGNGIGDGTGNSNRNSNGTGAAGGLSLATIMGIISAYPLQIGVNVALLIALVTWVLRQRRGRSKQAQDHKRFKEWITEGRVETAGKLQISILTLEGLVDLAIDLEKRVIHDMGTEKYYVLTEDLIYVHDMAKVDGILENKPQLGKLLLDRGLIRPDQLETGLFYQHQLGSKLGESLMALGFIDEVTLYSALASQQGIDYLELDLGTVLSEISWLERLELQKARALQVLPLGIRSDGKWVVASSEPAKPGVQQALREALGADILMAATRPSRIYEALENIAIMMTKKQGRPTVEDNTADLAANKHLSHEEQRQFKDAYVRGNLIQELLLKSMALSDSRLLKEGETLALLKGLEKAIGTMEWQERQGMQLPQLLQVLQSANFITSETSAWVDRESALQQVSSAVLLKRSHLASGTTLQVGEALLEALNHLLIQ